MRHLTRRGRIGQAAVAVSLAITLMPTTAFAATPKASGPAAHVALSGGDVVTLATPKTVLANHVVGSSWSSVPAASKAGIPVAAAGAAYLEVTAAKASKPGTVMVRPTGGTSAGTPAVSYPKAPATSLVLVQLGPTGAVDVSSTAGSPKVTVSLLAWVPATAPLSVAAQPPVLPRLKVAHHPHVVSFIGAKTGVPVTASAIVVGVTTSKANKPGSLKLSGSRKPAGIAYPKGAQTTLVTLAPSSTGKVKVTGSTPASLRLRVLGWTSGTTTLVGLPAAKTLGSVKPGKARKITIAGKQSVPKAATAVSLTVSAPAGATVRIWPGSTTSGAPEQTFTGTGGATATWLDIPSGRRVAVSVTGTKAKTAVIATGYTDTLGDQSVSFVAKPTTRLLSPGDVLGASNAAGTVTLAPSAGAVAAGEDLMVHPAGEAPYVALVTNVVHNGNGTQTVGVSAATLADAFTDYSAHFDGPVSQPFVPATSAVRKVKAGSAPIRVPTANPNFVPGLPAGLGLNFLNSDRWDCGPGIEPQQVIGVSVDYEGSAYLDFSLADRSVDFAAKGGVKVVLSLLGGASISCSVSGELPLEILLGATGLAMKFGGTASLTVTTPELEDGGTFQVTTGARVFVSFHYFDGDPGATSTAVPFGDVESHLDGLNVELDLGVFIAVGIALPPGVEIPVNPEVSLTVGVAFKVFSPEPADDPEGRSLRGDQCLNATMNPYIEVGAKVALDFFPDIDIDIARHDFDATTLYEGPCWGYSGTIFYTYNYTIPADGSGCTAEQCNYTNTIHETLSKTLAPQAASFTRFYDPASGSYGAPIVQPYSWVYTESQDGSFDFDPNFGAGPEEHCTFSITAPGDGAVGWDAGLPTKAWVLDGYDTPPLDTAYAESSVPDSQTNKHQVDGGDADCDQTTTDTIASVDAHGSTLVLADPRLMYRPTISLTFNGHDPDHPDWGSWTTTMVLVRHNYPR